MNAATLCLGRAKLTNNCWENNRPFESKAFNPNNFQGLYVDNRYSSSGLLPTLILWFFGVFFFLHF